jgi:superfamily II DNA or RNA helicase
MIDYILNGLKWSEQKLVHTKNGLMYVQEANIPKNFWEYWNKYKKIFQENGITPNKYNENWKLCKWTKWTSPKKENKKIQEQYKDKILREYQLPHTQIILNSLQKNNSAIDGSDTGTGKTFVALSLCKHLHMTPVILCSKSGIYGWINKAEKYFNIKNIIAANYEQYKLGNLKYLIRKDIKKTKVIETNYTWTTLNPNKHIIIFDEAHKCQNPNSLNSKMLIQAAKQKFKLLILSATLADNPLQMYSTGLSIGLFKNKREFFKWGFTRGIQKNYWGGLKFKATKENLQLIHNDLFPQFGSRIKISDLKDFPETLILPECYTMDEAIKIEELWNTASELPIIKRIRIRQEIELLKLPTFVEMTKDAIAEGNSVCIFLNFRESIEQISKLLKTKNIIYGGSKNREEILSRFQNNKDKIIICQTKSGGESIDLHDINGKHPRVSLISPPESAKALLQIFGRVQREGGKSKSIQKIIFCANTVEEEVANNLRKKINNIHIINDGDLENVKTF